MKSLLIDEVVEIPEMRVFHDQLVRVSGDTLAFHAPESTFYIDLPTRTISVDAPLPLPPAPVPSFGGRALQSFVHDGRAGVLVGGDRHILWSSPPARMAKLWPLDDEVFGLQINDQHLAIVELGDAPRVRWTGRFPPYIYDVMRMKHGVVLVATAGRGGSLFEVDSDGSLIRKTQVPGGASALVADRKSGRVVASGWQCVLVVDGKNDVRVIEKLAGAFRAVWFRGKRVACLCGDPMPGVVFARLA